MANGVYASEGSSDCPGIAGLNVILSTNPRNRNFFPLTFNPNSKNQEIIISFKNPTLISGELRISSENLGRYSVYGKSKTENFDHDFLQMASHKIRQSSYILPNALMEQLHITVNAKDNSKQCVIIDIQICPLAS
ncbi:hypothetical protein HELRODRAFT_182154 [Helobdella robusta]|uniref:Uncharacterized protein n=1 Tax=Helobdella robusta TaxID=6412 RepID=T1FHU3_HELRO|nr:hypothetical protein HELRODRAFT_182154 [Helobdella robusta]ESN91182.1 hypothetical protein HELRODRAFT_182154 [Helobdella robusta]